MARQILAKEDKGKSKTSAQQPKFCPQGQAGCLQNQDQHGIELHDILCLPQLTYENLLYPTTLCYLLYPATLCYLLYPANLCYVHCIFQQLERHQTTFPKLTVASDPDSVF